jgi:hypothetical protein
VVVVVVGVVVVVVVAQEVFYVSRGPSVLYDCPRKKQARLKNTSP